MALAIIPLVGVVLVAFDRLQAPTVHAQPPAATAHATPTVSVQDPSDVSASDFAALLQVQPAVDLQLSLDDWKLNAELSDGRHIRTQLTPSGVVASYLVEHGASASSIPAVWLSGGRSTSSDAGLNYSLLASLAVLVVGGYFLAQMYQRQRRGESSDGDEVSSDHVGRGFVRSKARLWKEETPDVRFAQVAGIDEAKSELWEIVEFLQRPEKFLAVGARIPRGVILYGPPGTGKTLLAKAIAGEAGVPFFSCSGSEFIELYVGVGAARVRDLFERARRDSPCIIFIDELDAIGRQRGGRAQVGNDERDQALNQLLIELDGFNTKGTVVLIGATNRADILDPALLRPGRFDRRVPVYLPNVQGRREILAVHSDGKPLTAGVDLRSIARRTPGFSGADLANLVNEAAIAAARANRKEITEKDFDQAIERVLAGPERHGRILSNTERMITAYHEMGHAIVAAAVPSRPDVHKVTIIPRGEAGGFTQVGHDEDRNLYTRSQFLDTLAWLLGGYSAELLVFGDMTNGASNDIERATGLARQMIGTFGMGQLGPMVIPTDPMSVAGPLASPALSRDLEKEMQAILARAQERATEALRRNRDLLERSTRRLLDVETITGQALDVLLNEVRSIPGACVTSGEIDRCERELLTVPTWKPVSPAPVEERVRRPSQRRARFSLLGVFARLRRFRRPPLLGPQS